jgi:hypothetical protein
LNERYLVFMAERCSVAYARRPWANLYEESGPTSFEGCK